MAGAYFYYVEANIVCLIIFGIMVVYDRLSIDRQEKQVKFDHALIAFMVYFFLDALWGLIQQGTLPNTRFSNMAIDLAIYLGMSAIIYTWTRFFMSVERIRNREKPLLRFLLLLPFCLSALAMVIVYLTAPEILMGDDYGPQLLYNIFLNGIGYLYLASIIVYTTVKAIREKNRMERRKHLMVGLLPLMVVFGGLVQMLSMPDMPVFCFCCAVIMLVFYIKSMVDQISLDPLTRLNNRGQMLRFIAQEGGHRDDTMRFVIMMDVNDFKMINDTYGHAEGDRALMVVAESLRRVVNSHSIPVFLGRYGGDEFIIIAHPDHPEEIEKMAGEIRERLAEQCREEGTPYTISIGIGYDALRDAPDSLQNCIRRADEKLYLDKERIKREGLSSRPA